MARCGCRPRVPSRMPSHSTQCLWCRKSCSQSLLLLAGEMPATYPPSEQASSPGTQQLLGTSLTVLKCSSPVAVYKSNSRVSLALSFCIPLGWAPQAGTMSWQVPERSLSCKPPAFLQHHAMLKSAAVGDQTTVRLVYFLTSLRHAQSAPHSFEAAGSF